MPGYYFERETRTPHSESYVIEDEAGTPLGRVDLHYASNGIAQATLCVAQDITEDELQALIGEVDDRLVLTADPFREDLVVTVWRGQSGGVYSEEEIEEDEDEDIGPEGGNGRR